LFYLESFIHGPSSDFEPNLNSSKTLFATHPNFSPAPIPHIEAAHRDTAPVMPIGGMRKEGCSGAL
jgi:hypothetical protein